jgi:hypothetical protein
LKSGTENRKKVIWAGVLGVLALILAARALSSFFSSPAAANAPEPVSAIAPAPRAAGRRMAPAAKATTRAAGAPRLDPTLDLSLLKESEDTKYAGSGRNIFVSQAEVIPKPIKPVNTDTTKSNTPPPPPPPPPILLKFFGFANRPGEPKKIFLSQGEDVFIAGEGDIVNRRYRILRITPVSVEIEDVLNNNRQSIPLTQG